MEIDKEELNKLYWHDKLSLREIAHHFGVEHRTINLKMMRYGIPRRERNEGIKTAWHKRALEKGLQAELTEEEKRLLALAIELEGSIGVHRRKAKHGYRYVASVQLANTKLELVKYVQGLAKMGTISGPRPNYRQLNRKSSYLWCTHNFFLVMSLLEKIKSYLITKKEQASLVLEFCKLRLDNYHKPFGTEEEKIYCQLKELNRRGIY